MPEKKKRNKPLKIDMPFEEAMKLLVQPVKKKKKPRKSPGSSD
ncbi:MAG: hypothetical protein ACJ76F_07975 [Bacteroidia bacterium]